MCAPAVTRFDEVAAAKLLAEIDAQQKYRKPKVPKDADFVKLATATKRKVNRIVDKLATGVLTDAEFIEAMVDVLLDGHTEAAVMGRKLAGDLSPAELDDELFAQVVVDGEGKYLARFLNDLQIGRYLDADGNRLTAQIRARAQLYPGKLRGTANETFILASADNETFAWHQLAAEPCDDCPRIEAGGPYTLATIPSYPGDGRTQCRTSCGCVLVRLSDNRFGFSRSY